MVFDHYCCRMYNNYENYNNNIIINLNILRITSEINIMRRKHILIEDILYIALFCTQLKITITSI